MSILRSVAPHLAIAVIAALVLLGAYRHGVSVTTRKYEAIQAEDAAAQAGAITSAIQQAREEERETAAFVASIDRSIQEDLRNEIDTRDRAIADLRAGALRVRDRFTCPAGGTGVPSSDTATSSGDATGERGLQREDAEFLIRLAAEADAVTHQLQACQALIRGSQRLPQPAVGPITPATGLVTPWLPLWPNVSTSDLLTSRERPASNMSPRSRALIKN